MIFLAYITSRYWLDPIPLDPDFADMLPVIKVMNERFLSGHWKHVYDPDSGNLEWYPAHLSSCHVASLCRCGFDETRYALDYRDLLCLFSFVGFLFISADQKKFFYRLSAQIAIAAFLFWWIFSRNDVHGLISMSEEGVVIFYFVLLCSRHYFRECLFIGIAASLCLLSRYSMIGWLIPCLCFWYCRKDFRKADYFFAYGNACFSCCFF